MEKQIDSNEQWFIFMTDKLIDYSNKKLTDNA